MTLFSIPPSLTDNMSLEEVIKRWQQHDLVTGIVVVGSGGRGTLKAESDYDVVLIVRESPYSLHVMLTTIDERMTDIAFIKQSLIDEMLTMNDRIKGNTQEGVVLEWIHNGVIYHDPTGNLAKINAMQPEIEPHTEKELHDIWFRVNFNLQHTKRMLTSDDPIYLMACDIRLLYMLSEVWVWFMETHGQAWRGEKHSIRYVQGYHPKALELHQQAIREPDRHKKFALYEQFCAIALAPIGGLWASEKITAFNLKDDMQWDNHSDLMILWHELLNL